MPARYHPEQIADHRLAERAYQDWAATFEWKKRVLECQGVDPEEAGYRILAEMGEFRFDHRSAGG